LYSLVNDGVPVGFNETGIDVQVSSLVAGSDGSFGVGAEGEIVVSM
jgi:hypothetical protein